jgi:hypothetical protein
METKTKGWVVLSEDGSIIHDFTFSYTRRDSQHKYTRLWSRHNWKRHYRKGCRCVKAERTIGLTPIEE